MYTNLIKLPIRLIQSIGLSVSLLMLVLLASMSTSAMAQTCSPNLSFTDVNTSFYTNNSSALTRTVSGYVSGSVKNGALVSLRLSYRPQVVLSANNINIFAGSYNSNSNSVRPTYTCSETTNSLVITVRNLHTRLEYSRTGVSSLGVGLLTIVVDKRGGPGRVSISYTHQVFTRTPDQYSKLFNGPLLTDAVPLSGGRLNVQNLR